MKCKVCGMDTRVVFAHKILCKYTSSYFYCDACGFLRTEDPYWLDEAYGSVLSASDTGLVQRNVIVSGVLSAMLFFIFDRHGKYLDIGGGCGLLTRIMRDIGFDFYWSDKYCSNLLAGGFEAPPDASFVAATAFEVLEHQTDPIGFLQEILAQARTRNIIISTQLFEHAPPKPEDWSYYAFETGQHISFYQMRTLRVIAEKLGLHCYSRGWIHLFSDKKINSLMFNMFASPVAAPVFSFLPKCIMKSRTRTDQLNIICRNR
ncbi:MAG: class I SAM-dependent methyltransferase [Nitrospirae bacterium]|nr:class I SAM-dependent methyltransferase [Nitrospirota bacterium]